MSDVLLVRLGVCEVDAVCWRGVCGIKKKKESYVFFSFLAVLFAHSLIRMGVSVCL